MVGLISTYVVLSFNQPFQWRWSVSMAANYTQWKIKFLIKCRTRFIEQHLEIQRKLGLIKNNTYPTCSLNKPYFFPLQHVAALDCHFIRCFNTAINNSVLFHIIT